MSPALIPDKDLTQEPAETVASKGISEAEELNTFEIGALKLMFTLSVDVPLVLLTVKLQTTFEAGIVKVGFAIVVLLKVTAGVQVHE